MSADPREVLRAMEEFSPFNAFLGIRGEAIEPGRAVLRLPVRPEFVGDPRRPALHGGVVSALADTAGGAAAWSMLALGESVSTVDLTIDYLEPAGLDAPLVATATVSRRGRRMCHVRVSVAQGERVVAEGRAVYNIHRRRDD